jgi:16S rRNA (uracil1498-N3)-methyltransferase
MVPYFFHPEITGDLVTLDEDASKHIISVLRMQKGEQLLLTDGKGKKVEAVIENDNRKKCLVKIIHQSIEPAGLPHVSIAISLVKNASRFEWFLEKATEIGVNEIIPLICDRTEKEKFREERLKGIITSAMLQSQQCRMPLLHEPIAFTKAVSIHAEEKFIAHCEKEEKFSLQEKIAGRSGRLILIGPEGDFTNAEIAAALQQNFLPVSLGNTRLRTETAGIVAATLLKNL